MAFYGGFVSNPLLLVERPRADVLHYPDSYARK